MIVLLLEVLLLVAEPRRVSSTLCALGSVARLSVSMTLSISSGLYSLSNADCGKPDSTGSHVDFARSMTDFQRYDSVPEADDDCAEDDDEDDTENDRADSDEGIMYTVYRATNTNELSTGSKAPAVLISAPSSPINTSGVRIIVDGGSECHSCSGEEPTARDFGNDDSCSEDGDDGGAGGDGGDDDGGDSRGDDGGDIRGDDGGDSCGDDAVDDSHFTVADSAPISSIPEINIDYIELEMDEADDSRCSSQQHLLKNMT